MKRTVLSMCVLGVLVLGLTASQAYAASPLVFANIPFAFSVQGKTLPAGGYTIERVWSADSFIYMIRGNDNPKAETIFTSETAEKAKAPAPDQTELVFDKIGNHYFLREMWSLGFGREVPEAKTEKRMLNAGLTVTRELLLASN